MKHRPNKKGPLTFLTLNTISAKADAKAMSKKKYRPYRSKTSKFTPEQMQAFMRLKPSLIDTASFFQVSTTTIERYIRAKWDKTFVEFRDENMVHTRHSLRRKLYQMAMSGNVGALIFALKNFDDFGDMMRQQTEVKDVTDTKPVLVIEYPKDVDNLEIKDAVEITSEKILNEPTKGS